MSTTPTQKSIIGTFINGRNATDDFLQFATNHGGTIFGWIDSDGHLQGSLLVGTGGGGSGTVTSVAFAGDGVIFSSTPSTPVTTSGNVSPTLLAQSANKVLAGPTTGSAATPTFRALVAADIPSSVIPSGAAGRSAYFSGTNSVAGGTVVLEMVGISGADLGAVMNTCASSLPAAGGTCRGDNLTGSLTLSTAVTTSKAVVYTFCGQTITQTAAVTLASANSGVVGCPGANTVFTKGANIDQFTLSAAETVVKNLSIAGAKGSFTGNGVVTATGATQAIIEGNVISAQANDCIFDNSATFSVNTIVKNFLFSWGLHAFQSTSTSQQSLFANNYALGDGSSTGAAILNGGSSTLSNNYIKDSNGVVLVDDSTAAQNHPVIGNKFNQTNGWPGLKISATCSATGNTISAGGANGPAVTISGGGNFVNNTVNVTNADGIDIVGGSNAIVDDNIVSVAISGTSNVCGINSMGDQINIRVTNNVLTVGGALGTETNYGVCDTPTGTHNLNILISGNVVSTTLAAGAAVFGYFLNNASGLNTNWLVTFQDNACVHMGAGACLKRTDAQNNRSTYINFQPGDATLDNGTGSTKDVFAFDNLPFTFSTLPSPVGNGSRVYCSDCIQAKPAAGSGGGALAVFEAGQWNGL